MNDPTRQLVRGTLHMLILKTLSAGGAQHGYGVARSIDEATTGVVEIEDGALYQALHRMQEREWVESEWGHAENGKRARFYRLTDEGERRLRLEEESWVRYAQAVFRALGLEGAAA